MPANNITMLFVSGLHSSAEEASLGGRSHPTRLCTPPGVSSIRPISTFQQSRHVSLPRSGSLPVRGCPRHERPRAWSVRNMPPNPTPHCCTTLARAEPFYLWWQAHPKPSQGYLSSYNALQHVVGIRASS